MSSSHVDVPLPLIGNITSVHLYIRVQAHTILLARTVVQQYITLLPKKQEIAGPGWISYSIRYLGKGEFYVRSLQRNFLENCLRSLVAKTASTRRVYRRKASASSLARDVKRNEEIRDP